LPLETAVSPFVVFEVFNPVFNFTGFADLLTHLSAALLVAPRCEVVGQA
jgi:hypothetical protein